MKRVIILAAALVLTACGLGRLPTLVPSGIPPVSRDSVIAWIQPYQPTGNRLIRFRWLYRTEQASAGGRGSGRIASPDSLRLDTAGPLGSGAASAMVVRDSAIWVQPKESIEKLVPNFPLAWAMLGIPRTPPKSGALRGERAGETLIWEFVEGADTLEFKLAGALLTAQARRDGRIIARSETTYGTDGAPTTARLSVPNVPARLDLTFTKITSPDRFEADVWKPRQSDSTSGTN